MTTFRDDRQRAEACAQLLRFLHFDMLFLFEDGKRVGPTDMAVEELTKVRNGKTMFSTGEGILLRVAFDLWNGCGGISLWEIQNHLSVNVIHAIAELLIASNENPELAGEPVDRWLDKWRWFRVFNAPEGFTVG